MKIMMHAKASFLLDMTLEQAQLLQRLSGCHYDHTCKAAGRLGGFIWGWINCLRQYPGDTEVFPVQADFHKLDLCLKIMEFGPFSTEDKPVVEDLRKSFRAALTMANEEMPKISFEVPCD